MKKIIAGILLNIIIPAATLAQKITVVKATEQQWGGGMAGHSGYNISIILKSVNHLTIDSIYIKNLNKEWGYALNTPCNGSWVISVDSLNHIYNINQSITHIEQRYLNNDEPDDARKKVKKADTTKVQTVKCNNYLSQANTRRFTGAAMVTYYYKGKKQSVVVAKIVSLPFIAYP